MTNGLPKIALDHVSDVDYIYGLLKQHGEELLAASISSSPSSPTSSQKAAPGASTAPSDQADQQGEEGKADEGEKKSDKAKAELDREAEMALLLSCLDDVKRDMTSNVAVNGLSYERAARTLFSF